MKRFCQLYPNIALADTPSPSLQTDRLSGISLETPVIAGISLKAFHKAF
jgi:hypothetical protein